MKINSASKKILIALSVLFFWFAVWFIISFIVNDSYYFPSPVDTFSELFRLFTLDKFYKVVLFTFLRVIAGLGSGIVLGVLLAFCCNGLRISSHFVNPIITVIKAMPVAVFIVILYLNVPSVAITIIIGMLMVLPIVYQNVSDGLKSVSQDLAEVCAIFELSAFKRFKLLTLPAVLRYLAPAVVTSIGLAFKSQVAVEIIIYAKDSIGAYMFDAKYNLNTPEVFAWALIVVAFSLLIEYGAKKLLRRVNK